MVTTNNAKPSQPVTRDKPRVTISGAGVLHVRASELIKSEKGRQQLAALAKIKTL